MKPGSYLFAGIFATFALGWFGSVLVPHHQIGQLKAQVDEENADIYPVNIGGAANQGRDVYVSNGCVYCHSQQVRDPMNGSDIERGWGSRRTVARDYLYASPALLGSSRMGPDLTNYGVKAEAPELKYKADAAWHYAHLYSPKSLVAHSNMPSYRFLFEKRKISGQRSADALNLKGKDAVEEGYEVVPKPEAKALVAYMLSLDRSHSLEEVKTQEAK